MGNEGGVAGEREVAREGDGEGDEDGEEEGVSDGGKSIEEATSSSRCGNRQRRS